MNAVLDELLGPLVQNHICPLSSKLCQPAATPATNSPGDEDDEVDVVSDEEREWTELFKSHVCCSLNFGDLKASH